MNCSLFVTNQYVMNFVLFEELVVDMKDGATGIAENGIDIFSLQTFNKNFCTAHCC